MVTKTIKRDAETGKTIINLGHGLKKSFPTEEPVEELTYDLLQFFSRASPRELAFAIGWETSRVKSALDKLEKNNFITMSRCFERKITWVKPKEDGA